MRKRLVLFFCFLLLFYGCKDNSTPQDIVDDVGLEKLVVGNTSVLEKLDKDLSYNYPDEVEKYSISLIVRAKNKNAIDLTVITNGEETLGSYPYYDCSLADGNNEIKIISTSKKDSSNKKTYTIKINKKTSTTPDESSSKIKELKVDENNITSQLDSKNIAILSDVGKTKNKVKLYVLPHNPSAKIEVSNGNESIEKLDDNTSNVDLAFGQNEIRVVITSEIEGAKLHIIKIYREEDLGLKSFNVDGSEYCEDGGINSNTIRFPTEKTETVVKIEAKADYATVALKHNRKEIKLKNGSCKLFLELGGNAVEVIVKGKNGIKTKTYSVIFMRTAPTTNIGKLITLKVDDKDVLNLLSKDNSITLKACNNDKTSLKVEARAKTGITIKVLNDEEVSGNGIYDVALKEGENKIVVQLYSGTNLVDTYSIFITRYPPQEAPNAPTAEEVQINIVLSDGVNGSPVDGSYINIFKTKTTTSLKRILVRNGKAKVNLPKNEFYDFKVEGRNTDYSQIRYAASDVISYYIDENTKVVPIVQFPLQRITRPAEAPSIKEFKFDNRVVSEATLTETESMKNIEIKVETSSTMEELQWNSPYPMLSVGFVPTNDLQQDQDFLYATEVKKPSKNADGKYESSWRWFTPYNMKLIKGEAFDVIIVLYDVANNRLEYHARFKTSDTTTEETSITVSDLNMEFTSYPTPSRLFSVGEDAFTHNSSHYSNIIYFKVKNGSSHVSCIGFDVYRKCVDDNEEFRLVKHFVYNLPKTSSNGYSNSSYHILKDNDGVLEDEKTYQYKIVAFTDDGKKSKLDSSPTLKLKVPKSTSLLLDYPVNEAVTKEQTKNMDYVFKLSNPKILETAKEIRLGFLISDRKGVVLYASKFKYVFEDSSSSNKDEIYFAKLNDAKISQGYYLGTNYSIKRSSVTPKAVQDLIKIDKTTGVIKLTKDFTSITQVNLTGQGRILYKEGNAYYWDVLDWGVKPYSDFDDKACKIVSKEKDGVIIVSNTNDYENGNNALNGRAEFTIRFD